MYFHTSNTTKLSTHTHTQSHRVARAAAAVWFVDLLAGGVGHHWCSAGRHGRGTPHTGSSRRAEPSARPGPGHTHTHTHARSLSRPRLVASRFCCACAARAHYTLRVTHWYPFCASSDASSVSFSCDTSFFPPT